MILTPQEQFLRYCIYGNFDEIILYYENNINEIDISNNNEEAFIWACSNGFINIAEWLLSKKTDINISVNNEQAFRSSCANGNLQVLKWLIQLKPDINISILEERAFTNACSTGNLEIVKWLYEYKPAIDITAENHYSICIAYQYKHYNIVDYLSEKYLIKHIDIPDVIFELNLSNNRKWLFLCKFSQHLYQCSICYDYINNYHITPCNHIFCKNCIQIWLTKNNSCPYCRQEI